MAVTAQILDGDVQLTGIRSRIKVSGGVQPANTIEYKYLLKVIDVDGKLLAPPDPDAIAPDSAGEAEFNISGIVDQPVKAVFQHPASGPFVEYPTQAFSVKVQPGETYVDDDPNSENYGEIVEVWGTESSAFQFLKGGMSQRQIAMFEASDTNFYQTYLMGGKFLTHRPWGDFVHPVQPVKLWFIPVSSVSATRQNYMSLIAILQHWESPWNRKENVWSISMCGWKRVAAKFQTNAGLLSTGNIANSRCFYFSPTASAGLMMCLWLAE